MLGVRQETVFNPIGRLAAAAPQLESLTCILPATPAVTTEPDRVFAGRIRSRTVAAIDPALLGSNRLFGYSDIVMVTFHLTSPRPGDTCGPHGSPRRTVIPVP